MSKPANIIELNGKRYDVRTGKMMPAHETVTHDGKSFIKPAAARPGVALDGFTPQHKQKLHPKTAPHPAQPHKAERSKTLMRTAVKKPAPATKSVAAETSPLRKHKAPRVEVDPTRIGRAKKFHKSHLISRFGEHAPLKALTSPLPVKPAPALPSAPLLVAHHETPLDSKLGTHPFDQAIHNATSHNQPLIKKTSRRHRVARKLKVSPKIINVSAAALATLLLVGFIGYQNMPNLSMRLATTRAGVHGSLPGYEPAGFGMNGPIQYKAGQITIHYRSHSDGREFNINQRSSAWDSETLLSQYVGNDRRAYQTYQDSGKTIYIYNGDNATWVDGGVWYQIEGNSSLNSDQLLRLAASM